MKICPICGRENNEEQTLCECGFNFQGTSHIPGKKEEETRNIVRVKKPKKNGRMKIVLAVLLTVIIAVGGVLFGIYQLKTMKWHEGIDPVIYLSDGNIMLSDTARPKADPIYLAKLAGNEENAAIYQTCFISKDKKSLVFCNGFEEIDEYFTVAYDVYYYSLEALSEPPLLIAEDVLSFHVNEGFDILTYEKAKDNTLSLYQSDFAKNEELICESFFSYSLSSDGKTLFYATEDNELYFKQKDASALLLSKKAYPVSVSDSFSEIIYCTDKGELIKEVPDGEKTLIAENVDKSFYKGIISDAGFRNGKGFYATKTKSYTLSDIFVDDMLEKDKKTDSGDEDYENKLIRDKIRSAIAEAEGELSEITLRSLYWYDGEKSHLIAENVDYFSNLSEPVNYGSVNCALIYTICPSEKELTIKMSEAYTESLSFLSPEDIMAKKEASPVYLAFENTFNEKLPFTCEEIYSYVYHENEEKITICITEENSEDKYYSADIRNGTVSGFTPVTEDTSDYASSDGQTDLNGIEYVYYNIPGLPKAVFNEFNYDFSVSE